MKLITILFFLMSASLFAQKDGDTSKHSGDPDLFNGQSSAQVNATEEDLDKQITALNERLMKHTKLFGLRVESLPSKTVLFKGVEKGDDCEPAADNKQTDSANTCIKIEVFDFIQSEEGKTDLNIGPRSKYIILFYEGGGWGQDPAKEAPKKIKRIKSKILVNNFKETDLKISEVVDGDPHTPNGKSGENKHDEKITVFYQHDGLPVRGPKGEPPVEQKDRKGYGLYKLADVENTRTNPTKNIFKQTYYIKHLIQFDKLFTKVYDMNDSRANKRYKESNQVLKSSLVY
ncbi:MAG TPA: hypothetical protein PK079_20525 [Leptospiraceae bacterium]|nr:hypothetical protein [Leptospiraceae bacterium]HMW03633.1 hypothetical protein [Leptospiraceae bacterium]HMX31240.1 hypothetical protein [Leptospiraceae bacterium]HMY29446.1 hypothetical protein [Leptospiraceae bacterium]HMZ67550.1 hypothetical protein [Leptospiraceae bacterium]